MVHPVVLLLVKIDCQGMVLLSFELILNSPHIPNHIDVHVLEMLQIGDLSHHFPLLVFDLLGDDHRLDLMECVVATLNLAVRARCLLLGHLAGVAPSTLDSVLLLAGEQVMQLKICLHVANSSLFSYIIAN